MAFVGVIFAGHADCIRVTASNQAHRDSPNESCSSAKLLMGKIEVPFPGIVFSSSRCLQDLGATISNINRKVMSALESEIARVDVVNFSS